MPGQTDEQNTEAEEGLSPETKPWLERDDWYVCRVDLGGEDYAELLAVSGDLAQEVEDTLETLQNVWPDDEDADTLQVLRAAFDAGLPDKLWKKLDKLLTRHVRDWDLSTYADKHRLDSTPRKPGDYDDPDERLEAIQSLPIPVLARLVYGLWWHSSSF